MTHAEPRGAGAQNSCTFAFEWTAPIASGSVPLYGAGNSVDGDLTTAGDRAANDTLVVTVQGAGPGELPPIADADGPYAALIDEVITFDGSGSQDSDGTIVAWDSDFGDGNVGSGPNPQHAFSAPGTYTVSLTVEDDDGRIDTDETTARVFAAPGNLRAIRVAQVPEIQGIGVFLTAPRGDDRLFAVRERRPSGEGLGGVEVIIDGEAAPTPFLEIPIGLYGAESGVRGLAFPDDYASTGLFYILYTNLDDDTVISRFQVSADPNVADASSEEILLVVPQPSPASHNGSHIEFGPDGMLWAALGDGGGSSGPEAQNDEVLLAKLIRPFLVRPRDRRQLHRGRRASRPRGGGRGAGRLLRRHQLRLAAGGRDALRERITRLR